LRSRCKEESEKKNAQVQFGSVRSFVLAVADGEAAEEEEEAAVVDVADETAVLVETGAVVVEFEIVVEMLDEEGLAETVAFRVAEGVTDGVVVCRSQRRRREQSRRQRKAVLSPPYNVSGDIDGESCTSRASDATAVLERVAAASQAARAGSERLRSRIERVGSPAFFRSDLLGQQRHTTSV
jgi:hypothetical protein